MANVLPIDRKQRLLSSIEVGYVEHEVVLYAGVVQRLYGRLFDVTQLNLYSLRMSAAGRDTLKELDQEVQRLLDELLSRMGGIEREPPDAGAQRAVAKVISPVARKYLRCIVLLDRIVACSPAAERHRTTPLIRSVRRFAVRCAEAAFKQRAAEQRSVITSFLR